MDGSSPIECGQEPVVLTSVASLKRHEEIDAPRAEKLLAEIATLGIWTTPLLVEEETDVILDGHHRFWCAGQLGLDMVPTVRVPYGDPALALSSWREEVDVTPELVIAAAISGNLLPKKTSRHIYASDIISCNILLTQLRRRHVA